MPHRSKMGLAAAVIVGIAFIATISTDALAYRRGGYERAQAHSSGVHGPSARPDTAGGAGAAAAGARHKPRCGYYRHPPCQ
jgi:hypothetical protein